MTRAIALAAALVGLQAIAAQADERPNVILFMAEDLSARIGAYGDDVAHTPHIDRLAEQGTRYTRTFLTAGVCAASRAAMIMGVHQNHFGAGHMRVTQGGYAAVPPPDWKAFPELLRQAGYYTVNNGKTDYQFDTGLAGTFGGPFTIWDETSGEDWRGRAPGQPFFLYYNLGGTHESQTWPTWQWPHSITAAVMAPMRVLQPLAAGIFETDPSAGRRAPDTIVDTPAVREVLARHYNNIGNVDRRRRQRVARRSSKPTGCRR